MERGFGMQGLFWFVLFYLCIYSVIVAFKIVLVMDHMPVGLYYASFLKTLV